MYSNNRHLEDSQINAACWGGEQDETVAIAVASANAAAFKAVGIERGAATASSIDAQSRISRG